MFDSFGVSGGSDVQRIPNARRSASFLRQAARHHVARITKREVLRDLVGTLAVGETWHILTSGDLDAGHVLDYLVHHHGPFGRLYLSTWSMERQHIDTLSEHLRANQFSGFILLTGDYFAQRSPANYTALVQLADASNGKVYRFNNHSKLMAMARPDGAFAVVVEGSANFTRNPRVENCCITVDADYYAHVEAWFHELTERRHEFRF